VTHTLTIVFFTVSNIVNAGLVQGTASFELVRMNILALLRSRRRDELIPVWEKFLSLFPDGEVDDKVPCDDVYGEVLQLSRDAVR
jgi:hypothetical protein